MATRKSNRKSTATAKQTAVSSSPQTPKMNLPIKQLTPVIVAVIVGLLLFVAARQYRGYVLAAIVNKTPISTFELNKILIKRYGQTTLDELINEKLLSDLATQNQVTITATDIQSEVTKLEETLGGKDKLEAAMVQYGLDQKQLESQIKIRLLQQKLAEKITPVTVSDEEVKKYYDDNKLVFKDQKFDDAKDQIKKDLADQKLQTEFMKWFQDQKTKASIHVYLTQ